VGIDYAVRVQQIGFLVKIMKGAGEGKALPRYGRARNVLDKGGGAQEASLRS